MRNLQFKRISAKNFLPFGPDGIEINFSDYGNIIWVHGENRDAKTIERALPTDNILPSSNGTGKSSLQEIIVWTLYGRTIKRPEKINVDDVIHNKIKRDCECSVNFGKYRVVRTRMDGGKKHKNSLRLWGSEEGVWDDSTEMTKGDMRATQKLIEEIIGLSYDSFVNISVFTDDQRSCFLECEPKVKREIVENLLSLGIYREWFENAKADKKETNVAIASKAKEYSLLLGNKDDAVRRLNLTETKIEHWISTKQTEQKRIEEKIAAKTQELKTTDAGQAILAYQKAQETILEINNKIPPLEADRKKEIGTLNAIEVKEQELRTKAQFLTEQTSEFSARSKGLIVERTKREEEIRDLRSATPGTHCYKCRSVVDSDNIESYTADLEKEIVEINTEITGVVLEAKKIGEQAEQIKSNQSRLKSMKLDRQKVINNLEFQLEQLRNTLTKASQVREPKADSAEFLLQQQIEELKKQHGEKGVELTGPSPFNDILANDKLELQKIEEVVLKKEQEVKALEALLPYYDYWLDGFGEYGIRKWVIEGIIPELNTRVNYWLQFLIDNAVTLKFDDELKEKIERNPPDGDPYIYHAMSTGQRRRLNLSVGHSFAYITEISAEAIPSVIFLDEVSTNVDPLGVQGIYNMIQELAEDKQVFVTTHDPDLIRMLQGASVIKLIHENGFTRKAN